MKRSWKHLRIRIKYSCIYYICSRRTYQMALKLQHFYITVYMKHHVKNFFLRRRVSLRLSSNVMPKISATCFIEKWKFYIYFSPMQEINFVKREFNTLYYNRVGQSQICIHFGAHPSHMYSHNRDETESARVPARAQARNGLGIRFKGNFFFNCQIEKKKKNVPHQKQECSLSF